MTTNHSTMNSPRLVIIDGREFIDPGPQSNQTSTNERIKQVASKNSSTTPRNPSKFDSIGTLSGQELTPTLSPNDDSRTGNVRGSSTPLLSEMNTPNARPTSTFVSDTASTTTTTQRSATPRSNTSTSTNTSAIRPAPAAPAPGQATVTQLKIYSQVFNWNGHSYTIRESLPVSTTNEEWNAIVRQYQNILDGYKNYAGVISHLTLTLDCVSRKMNIDIPSKETITVPRNNEAVEFLFLHHPISAYFQSKNDFDNDDSDVKSSTSRASILTTSQIDHFLSEHHSKSVHRNKNDDSDEESSQRLSQNYSTDTPRIHVGQRGNRLKPSGSPMSEQLFDMN